MSTQRIEQTVQGYTYQRPKKAREDVDFPLGTEQSKSRQDQGDGARDLARGQILSLLNRVDGATGGGLSFADVIAHHEAVQSRWTGEVAGELAELGVNVDTSFSLMYDPAGMVTAAGGHPDSEMINSYFVANPGRVGELGDILQYGKLASVAEAQLSQSEKDQAVSVEAMAGWYAGNMDIASLSSGGGMPFGAGGTVYKGLDIRV